MNIAVLGCGPAGLLAAHASTLNDHSVTIFSRKERSKIHGAQYIHEPIPELCEGDPTEVSFTKIGDEAGYAYKVYGATNHETSWHAFGGIHRAWPMSGVYSLLWAKYASLIESCEFGPQQMRELLNADMYDLVFCSLPRQAVCEHQEGGPDELAHQFNSARVMFAPYCNLGLDNVVMYSGRDSEPWYRTSRLFGHDWTEYGTYDPINEEPRDFDPLPEGWRVGIKPTTTDCDCFDGYHKLVRIGRFGQWSKRVLVTDAFADALEALPNDDPFGS